MIDDNDIDIDHRLTQIALDAGVASGPPISDAWIEPVDCDECKGTGWYTGLNTKEPCSKGCLPS